VTIARVVPPAVSYWAGVFALGVVLGTARVLWLAPTIGELAAVAAELPLMLAASWWLARRLVAGRALTPTEAAAMGALALALLLASEAILAVALGQSLPGWLASLASLPGGLGLAGQLGFAAMPWLVRRDG
jgi:hypothetical protein